MRILIQQKADLTFWGGQGWVKEDGVAFSFQNTAAAIRHCQEARLSDVQIVLKFHDSSMDVKLDVLSAEQLKNADTTKFRKKAGGSDPAGSS